MNRGDLASKVDFSETVVIIDVEYLNFMIKDVKDHFEKRLNRSLPEIFFPFYSHHFCYDAGLQNKDNNVQFLFVHSDEADKLYHVKEPCSELQQLDGLAYETPVGNFNLLSVPTKQLVSCENLVLDLFILASDSKKVKNIIVAPFYEDYGVELDKLLKKEHHKNVTVLTMSHPENAEKLNCKFAYIAFGIMQALGITAADMD